MTAEKSTLINYNFWFGVDGGVLEGKGPNLSYIHRLGPAVTSNVRDDVQNFCRTTAKP